MVKRTDIIKSNKTTGCNNCIFCFSRCLKCGALDITVEYRNIFHYKYRNKFNDHIYVTKLEKRSLGKPPLLKIDCDKCKNKITAIGEINRFGNVQYSESYNRKKLDKRFRSNSKYYNQAKFLFQFLEKIKMIPFDPMMISADGFHVYIDGTNSKMGVHSLKIEWYDRDRIYYLNNLGILKMKRNKVQPGEAYL
jgi:hypothetical protein